MKTSQETRVTPQLLKRAAQAMRKVSLEKEAVSTKWVLRRLTSANRAGRISPEYMQNRLNPLIDKWVLGKNYDPAIGASGALRRASVTPTKLPVPGPPSELVAREVADQVDRSLRSSLKNVNVPDWRPRIRFSDKIRNPVYYPDAHDINSSLNWTSLLHEAGHAVDIPKRVVRQALGVHFNSLRDRSYRDLAQDVTGWVRGTHGGVLATEAAANREAARLLRNLRRIRANELVADRKALHAYRQHPANKATGLNRLLNLFRHKPTKPEPSNSVFGYAKLPRVKDYVADSLPATETYWLSALRDWANSHGSPAVASASQGLLPQAKSVPAKAEVASALAKHFPRVFNAASPYYGSVQKMVKS
jgi:hypothetical protein